MKAQLVKHALGYILFDEKGIPIGAEPNVLSSDVFSKLSTKNCQAIERGYDLDELAKKHHKLAYIQAYNPDIAPYVEADYKAGFQKALELMGDKKFSEEDMFKMFTYGHALTNAIKLKAIEDKPFGEIFNDFIQSLQQTEWDVEIEMEEVSIGDKYTPDTKPKLDTDGCLILKLIK